MNKDQIIEAIKNMTVLEPVSYTHLIIYRGVCKMFISRGGAGCRVSPDSWLVGGFYHGPVSYTHLDELLYIRLYH